MKKNRKSKKARIRDREQRNSNQFVDMNGEDNLLEAAFQSAGSRRVRIMHNSISRLSFKAHFDRPTELLPGIVFSGHVTIHQNFERA